MCAGFKDYTERKREMADQTPQLRIRISRNALKELDEAAQRSGRSRNAEATSRIEGTLVSGGSSLPDKAIETLVAVTVAKVSVLREGLGLTERGQSLAMLRGALDGVLDALGAENNDTVLMLGSGAGRRVLDEARHAMTKQPKERSAEEEALARAAEILRLGKGE